MQQRQKFYELLSVFLVFSFDLQSAPIDKGAE